MNDKQIMLIEDNPSSTPSRSSSRPTARVESAAMNSPTAPKRP
jgi:hypothetical protein